MNKILLIDPDPTFRKQVEEMLKGQDYSLEYAPELSRGINILEKDGVSLIFLSLSLPDCKGLEVISKVYAKVKDIPIIALFEEEDVVLEQHAIYNGAISCLFKKELDTELLRHSIQNAFRQQKLLLDLIRAKSKLQVSEIQLRDLIECVQDGLTLSDREGHFEVFNAKMQEITGYTLEEANTSSDFSALIYSDPQDRQKALASLNEIKRGRPCETETTIQAKDGTIKTLLVTTSLIDYEDREMFLSVYSDITIRKKTEEELKRAHEELKKVNQLKTDFVSTVSHELRTPLTTMKEFTLILLDEIPGKINKEQKEYLNIIHGNIDRLARIIANLLDISKIEARKMELKKDLVSIETLVKDVVSGLKSRADAKHITVKTLFPRVLSDVYIDSDRITQVFTNLIDNAIKFTLERGKIVVEIKAGEKEIECSVSDTGIGIAPEDRDKLFEKFMQIDRTPGPGTKGTGLGLAIVRDLIQLHNGKIWVESEIDKGSKFIFTLPKITAEEIFKEYIINGLKETADRKSSLSLIVVRIVEFSQLQKKWGEKPLYLLTDIERVIKDSLRHRADTVLRITGELVIPLPDTRKADAEVVKTRIEKVIKTYLSQSKEEWIKEIRITLGSATYPEEANNHQELLDKARGGGGTKYKRVKNNVKKISIRRLRDAGKNNFIS